MAIYFRTGRPGSAKTLSTIEEVINAQKLAEKKDKPRKVYYSNIIRFDKTHPKFLEVQDWIPLSYEQILKIYVPDDRLISGNTVLDLDWFDNNSILLVDEAQLLYPAASPFSKKHPHLTWLSHHRHSGIDIYYCAQSEKQMHTLFKEQVKYHKHLTQLGSQLRSNFKQSSDGILSQADSVTIDGGSYSYNKEFFGLYESATEHSDNKNFFENFKAMPIKIKLAIFILPVALIFFIYAIFSVLSPDLKDKPIEKQITQKQKINNSPTKEDSFLSSFSPDDKKDKPHLYISSLMVSNGRTLVLFDYVKSDLSSITINLDDIKKMKLNFKTIRDGVYLFDGALVTYAPPGEVKEDSKNDKK